MYHFQVQKMTHAIMNDIVLYRSYYKLLFHVHLSRFGDILIWIDCRKYRSESFPYLAFRSIYPLICPTTSTELGQKTITLNGTDS
jgi:hypothetical protein